MYKGTLLGFDQLANVILKECHERVYSTSAGVQLVPLGLYIIRGDNVAVIGEINVGLDASLTLQDIMAEPLGKIVH